MKPLLNRLFLSIVISLAAGLFSIPAQAKDILTDQRWVKAREQYQAAQQALEQRDFPQYLAMRKALKNYPLYPYLEYNYLSKRLDEIPAKQVHQFLKANSHTPLAQQLQHRWLKSLATSKQWALYLKEFDDSINNAELRCYALWAEHQAGHTQKTLEKVPALWVVGHSQPNACDPIFKVWIDGGYLTGDQAWQRFKLAMHSANTSLARYLIQYLSAPRQTLAQLYRDTYLSPERLQRTSQFQSFNDEHQQIIFHSITRLARKDALLAYQLWPHYRNAQNFTDAEQQRVAQQIIFWLAHQNQTLAYQQALKDYPHSVDSSLIEAGMSLAIRQQDWPAIIKQYQQFPGAAQQSERWQYWYARARLQTSTGQSDETRSLLEKLARQRSYYSFLAADHLQTPYQMNAQSYPVDGSLLKRFKVHPGIIRARELFLTGQTFDARREWYRESQGFNVEQHYAAAHYAYQLQWYSQAIRSAINAERWDDLELRFPLAFEKNIHAAAQPRKLNTNWLLAMARQESAMTADALSPKGAMGLIQILPGTAKIVARKNNIQYHSKDELFNPDKNIELASAYLDSLLNDFEGNDIYATAAYNAGPYRVKKWLETTRHLPIDVWIESIPYAETRNYVKNVLTYSAVFAHRRNHSGFQMATVNYLTDKPAIPGL